MALTPREKSPRSGKHGSFRPETDPFDQITLKINKKAVKQLEMAVYAPKWHFLPYRCCFFTFWAARKKWPLFGTCLPPEPLAWPQKSTSRACLKVTPRAIGQIMAGGQGRQKNPRGSQILGPRVGGGHRKS